MRVKYVIASGLLIGVLLVVLFNLLTPANKLKPAEVEVCVAIGVCLGMVLERLTRQPEQAKAGAKKKTKGKKRR